MRSYYPGIQGLRGAAALLVVLQHSIAYACIAAGLEITEYLKVGFGAWGVMLFFCISGFVIASTRKMPLGKFAIRRALRIYPPFLVACLISILLLRFAGIPAELDTVTALLLPVASFNNSLNIPYWTLIFEVAFYATFSIVLLFSFDDKALSIGCVVWIALVMALGNYFPNEAAAQAPGAFILLSPYTQLFALGVLTYLHQDWLARQDSRWLIAVTIGVLYLLNAFRIVPAGYILLYGIACSCIVSLASRAIHVPCLARVLGDASYGIYLLHLPVLVVLARWLSGTVLAQHPLWLWTMMTAIALGVSTVFGLVEFISHRRAVTMFRTE